MRTFLWTALLALAIPLSLAGCGGDSGGGDDTAGGNSDFVGEWHVTGAEGDYYITFGDDGSVIMADSQGGPAHLTGSYTVDGDTASGPLTNPGVGEASFFATLTGDDTMDYEFIEHWHSPWKHVPLTGVRQ